MPAYIIARVAVTDWDRYREYTKATPEVIALYGGKFIVRGGEIVTLEGEPEDRRLVVIEFPSRQRAKEFFNSPEYTRVKEFRKGAAIGQFLLVDGFQVERARLRPVTLEPAVALSVYQLSHPAPPDSREHPCKRRRDCRSLRTAILHRNNPGQSRLDSQLKPGSRI